MELQPKRDPPKSGKALVFVAAVVCGGLGIGILAGKARTPAPAAKPGASTPAMPLPPPTEALAPRPKMGSLLVQDSPPDTSILDELAGPAPEGGGSPDEGPAAGRGEPPDPPFDDTLAGIERGGGGGKEGGARLLAGKLRELGAVGGGVGGGGGGGLSLGAGPGDAKADAKLTAFPQGSVSPEAAKRRAFDARTAQARRAPASREPAVDARDAGQAFSAPVGEWAPPGKAPAAKLPAEPNLSEEGSQGGGEGDSDSSSGGGGAAVDPRFGSEGPEAANIPKLYRLAKAGSDTWSAARGLKPTLDAVKAELAKVDADYRVSVEDETSWSDPANLGGAMKHLERRLATRYVGDVVLVEKRGAFDSKGKVWRVRIVRKDPKPPKPTKPPKPKPDKPPPPANTVGTDRIDVQHAAAWAQFPGLESWGICNCRRISGSSTWSQHAWCNAEDIHRDLPGKTVLQSLDPVHAWLSRNRAKLGIEHLIYRTTSHWDHIHSDMRPNGRGTPPCAR